MKQIFIIIAAVLLISSCRRQELITETEAIEAIRKFDKAWESKNSGGVDSAISPRYVYFTQSGKLFSRDSIIATAAAQAYLLDSASRSEFEVTLSGNTAIVSTRWRGKGVYYGNRFAEDQRCSITLVKENGFVRILSEHCTPIRKRSAKLYLPKGM